MSKERATIGTDGLPLPLLPPVRDARVCGRMVRVMFYTPGFMGLLLIKAGEPAAFGITVELLMLSSAAAIIGGLFIASESKDEGADNASKVGTWSGQLVLELLSVVPFLCALPSLFHELAHSTLLHSRAGVQPVDIALGTSEILPALAILPFMIYQLAGFGTLNYVMPKIANWAVNAVIVLLIVGSYIANREGDYFWERRLASLLIIIMVVVVFHGIARLKQNQAIYDARCPPPKPKKDKDKD
jgi:hypothetical protein